MGCPLRWIHWDCCWTKEGSERLRPLVQPLLYLHSGNQIRGNELLYLWTKWNRMELNWNVWAMADTTTRSRTKYRRTAMAKEEEEEYRTYWLMNIEWCCGLFHSIAVGLYIPSKHLWYCARFWLIFSRRSWLEKFWVTHKFSLTRVLDISYSSLWLVANFKPTSLYCTLVYLVASLRLGRWFNFLRDDRKSAVHW